MLSFVQRLELLEQDLRAEPPAFAMSADLPFAIFRYDPFHPEEREWEVRRQVELLATRIQKATGKNVTVLPLSRLYWKSIEESESVDEIIQLERARGFMAAELQVSNYLSDPDWRCLTDLLIEESAALRPDKDVLFLTRAAVFAPSSYRISSLLEQLMGRVRIPAVLFYPGTWRESLNYLGMRSDNEALGSYRVKIYGRE